MVAGRPTRSHKAQDAQPAVKQLGQARPRGPWGRGRAGARMREAKEGKKRGRKGAHGRVRPGRQTRGEDARVERAQQRRGCGPACEWGRRVAV